MSTLSVNGLTKYYGADFIFGNLSFQVTQNDKVALVGVNGAGKSTLLKIIANSEMADEGQIHVARGTRIAYLAQETRFETNRTLWEEMESAMSHLRDLQQQITDLEAIIADTNTPNWDEHMEQYGELQHRFEHGGGYEIEQRIKRVLDGLGFREAQYHQPLEQFSGGQKTRAALATTLLSDPDLLLLDEPTNHLDLATLDWLERFLLMWHNALIVISHDRYFLNRVTNRTLDLAFGKLEDYPAAYNKYLLLKAERLELLLKQYQAQQAHIAKTEEFIRRFKAGQRSKEARGRERRLQRLKEGWQGGSGQTQSLLDRPDDQKQIAFKLQTQVRSGEQVLKFDQVGIGYPQSPNGADTPTKLFECTKLTIQSGQRIALIGPNGSGKTTLLRTIVGEQMPLHGQIHHGYNVVINYYAQAHEGLQHTATILDEVRRTSPSIEETRARTLLGHFLFSGDDVFKRVGDLSGGERSRVALAQLMLMQGNLLVLDEPTNHLDIDSREALETVLNEYNGTILFVSHDRYFIDAVADTIWAVQDGRIVTFDGTFTDYTGSLEQTTQATGTSRHSQGSQRSTSPHIQVKETSQTSQKAQHQERVQQNREERKKQRRLSALEEEIATLEAELQQIEEQMHAASLAGDIERVTKLGIQHTERQETLSTRYDEWAAIAD
ncbi:MAG: ABC transporter ATP-binding protein [Chloroflexi bacterium AL-W]|nr:ABC transporter ATP-binding protein [Chloroflexi bacterium AL-N1]NOK68586.1 ABC transporter ATP-binding protein [Chloroflexi bacterium AL-N10]NOK76072.1 ABC transporter ATP-binding protein [Chloroflexi bacterium AL-N5]NOK82545.1 ABC transporter ATP-binding protein [Chloroflexi bacterium AL-W]NOK92855.1 ABC transporter ATP-binding protein [Chloroflexi bacterium AL-N15]